MPHVEVEFSDLKFHETIGFAGSVYRAVWLSKEKVVAVKKMESELMEREAEVLSSLSHRNIIQFFGAVTVAPNYCIITEYAERGSLYKYLKENSIDSQQILQWAQQIALGMNYLHYEAPVTVIHRDLKSKNVVITSNLTAKLCNFGSSYFYPHTTQFSMVGTFPWMAPEVIQHQLVTTACDVFSYSVLLWELLTQEVPYKGVEGLRVAWLVVAKEQRLTIPSTCPPVFATLMTKCWQQQPQHRPSFKEILAELNSIMENGSVQEEIDHHLSQKAKWKEELKELESMFSSGEQEIRKSTTPGEVRNIEQWGVQEVVDWLFSLPDEPLAQYATLFEQQHISGHNLLSLTDEDLLVLGMLSLGHRKLLLEEVERLRHGHSTNNSSAKPEVAQSDKIDDEAMKFCANVEKHLKNSGALNRFLAHIVFVGLPGSGKTTLIARLLNVEEAEEIVRLCGSTGVMEGIVTVDVAEDKASMHAANIGNFCVWHRVEFSLSCLRQMGIQCFVLEQSTEERIHAQLPRSESSAGNAEASMHDVEVTPQSYLDFPQRVSYDNSPESVSYKKKEVAEDAMATILKLLRVNGFSAVHPFLDNKSSLYLSDTGGQIEFQELLPLLVAGLAIFVFLFPLNVDLDKQITICYRKKREDKLEYSNVYTSSLTIKESFLQTLASIDSMESSSNLNVDKHNPYVFVVGTHKDCLVKELGKRGAEKRIAEINGRMKSLIEEHKYESLVIYADKANDEVLFPVDNTCMNETFSKIRLSIMDLLHSRDEFRVQFPLSYLLASLHLQECSQPFVKRSDFAQEILQYGIEEEDVDHLLHFLHTRIGQIRHFPLEDIKEVIVKEPQALYNLVTCIITKSFISRGVTMKEYSEVQRGIYSLESFDINEFLSQSEFLTPKQVIHLLKELRIVAPFHDHAAGVEKYFIPCVLNHLTELPDNPFTVSTIQPLAIMFDCGRCPKGMFGVLLHYILTHENKQLDWNLDINKIFRDQVSFEVGLYKHVVTVKFHTTHLEVRCSPMDVAERNQVFTLKKICNAIRSTVESGIMQATKSLHYSQLKTKHKLGLVCAECRKGHEVTGETFQLTTRCPKLGGRYISLPDSGSLWFGAPPSIHFPELIDCVSLKECSDYMLEFKITSDPSLDTQGSHVLSKVGGAPRVDHVYVRGTAVHFKRVRRCDAGTYTVSTSNAIGKGQASFQLKIKSSPRYVLETDYLEAVAGTSPVLPFIVTYDSPLTEDTEHTLTKSDGTKAPRRFKVESCLITFRKVRVDDSGEYTISCCSEEGEVGQATLELEITPAPHSRPQEHAHGSTLTGTVVRSKDVSMLVGHLHNSAYKWRAIGTSLNFLHGELENISRKFPAGATQEQLLAELLSQWSQWPTAEHSDIPTMERLCDALCSGLVGLGAEASCLYGLRHTLPSLQSS